ncbi:MAG: DUF58 domain-containing protein [Saprospiraceae bacterium]|nr:DUF58 domain-containing protein [Saprospiraceae bacterium]
METAELLRKVRKLEIKTKRLSRHLFTGEYHSAFKGRGMSFSEVRSYQFGDDVRHIDWNVSARAGQPFVKVFEEERELTVMLLVDMSASSLFGAVAQTKREFQIEIAALLAFAAIQNNDKAGIIFFTDEVELFIPPQKGRHHILRIIRELVNFEPRRQGTDIAAALEYFSHVIKKRSIGFLISDFAAPQYEHALRIAARRHELIGVQVSDPLERELPNAGLMHFSDPETGRRAWMDTSSQPLRREYAAAAASRDLYFKDAFQKSGADALRIGTDESYVHALMGFFQRRRV